MITDEQLDELPEDNEAAFVIYEDTLRQIVREWNSDRDYRGWDIERDYVAHILAFADNRPIDIDLPRNPPYDDESFSEWHKNFTRSVDYYKASARLRIAARRKKNITTILLSPDFKAQIGGHLVAIRNIVGGAELPESKRDAIYRRINGLQEEVDRDKTRTEAVVGLWLDITSAIGKGAENLDPVIDRLERIMGVFAKARDENEQSLLSAPAERKRIAAPTSAPSATRKDSAPTSDDLDEIPF